MTTVAMYGLNAGYDTRSLKSGNADTGVNVWNKKTVGFQQIAVNAEAVSNGWTQLWIDSRWRCG